MKTIKNYHAKKREISAEDSLIFRLKHVVESNLYVSAEVENGDAG